MRRPSRRAGLTRVAEKTELANLGAALGMPPDDRVRNAFWKLCQWNAPRDEWRQEILGREGGEALGIGG